MMFREPQPGSAGVFVRRTLALCIAGIAMASASCSMVRAVNPLSTSLSLYNASGRTLLIGNKEVPPGKTVKVGYLAGSRDRLFVFSAGCVFSFANPPGLPEKFESGGFFGSKYHAQLEGDGRIFLVLPGVRRPVAEGGHAEQPPGFPLTPSRASGCQAEEPTPDAGASPASTSGKP